MPTEGLSLLLPFFEGSQLGNYVIQGKLGAGGMGVVYRAKDTTLLRQVAIKVIKTGEAGHAMERFLRELEISAHLDHPHIVKIYHVGVCNKFPYCVMEYIQGLPLLDYVETHCLPLAGKLTIIKKIAMALVYAHKYKVIHRDIKPSNILVRDNGDPVLMDFGIAKITQSANRSITRSGEVVGTLEYMSPEQAEGKKREIDARTDIYGLGAVLYHLLTGRPPVTGSGMMEKIYNAAEGKTVPPSQLVNHLPLSVEKICLKALEKKQSNRYSDAKAMVSDIEAYLEGKELASTRRNCASNKVSRLLHMSTEILVTGLQVVLRVRDFCRAALLKKNIFSYIRLLTGITAALIVFFGYLILAPKPGEVGSKSPSVLEKNIDKSRILSLYQSGLEKYKKRDYHEAYFYWDYVRQKILENERLAMDEQIKKIAQQLSDDLIEVAFEAGEYQKVYAFSRASSTKEKPFYILCYIARAAYHCGYTEKAKTMFEELEKGLTSIPEAAQKSYLQVLSYYRGMIFFSQKRWAAAAAKFKEVIHLVEQDKTQQEKASFAPALYLYYCATYLVDIDQPMTPEGQEAIKNYFWQAASSHDLTSEALLHTLYHDTQARYYLKMAELSKAKESAGKVIEHIEECLKNQELQAEWYYIRGKAYAMLGQAGKAQQDFDVACQLAPGQLGPFLAKIDLLWLDPKPAELRNIFSEFPTRIFKGIHIPINLFAHEFAQLAESYGVRIQGIPFNQGLFDHYAQQLWSGKEEDMQIAQKVIASMVPTSVVKRALGHLMAVRQTDIEFIHSLMEKADVYEQACLGQECLSRLARVPWTGTIWHVENFYPKHTDRLKEILADERQNMFLRFLAARVLTGLPSLEERESLWQKYLQEAGQTNDMTATIMVAHAFLQLGYVHTISDSNFNHLAAQWIKQQRPHDAANQFLECLLADILLPADPTGLDILIAMLDLPSKRSKLMAASRFLWPQRLPPAVFSKLLQVLRDGIFNGSEQTSNQDELSTLCQTATLSMFCRFLTLSEIDAQMQWQIMVDQHFLQQTFAYLHQRLRLANPPLQNAILQFWREAARLLVINDDNDLIRQMHKKIRPLWTNPDPLVRYQALMASSALFDPKLMEKISPAEDANLLENIACLLGAASSASMEIYRQKAWFSLLRVIGKNQLMETKNWRMRMILLYLVGSEAGHSVFHSQIQAALQDPEPYMRCVGIVCMGRWSQVNKTFLDRLRQMAREDTDHMVRATALGMLIHHTYKQQSPDAENWHQYAKQSHECASEDYALAVGWGYSIPWELYIFASPFLRSKFNWQEEQHWAHIACELVQHCKDLATRKEYMLRLQKSLDILEKYKNLPIYQEHTYLLALLYEQEGRYKDASDFLAKIIGELAIQDTRFIWMWTQLMVRQDRIREAQQRIEELLARSEQYQTEDYATKQALTKHQAQLLRSLALLCLAQGNKSRGRQLLLQQYLLYPQQPDGLQAWAEFYYAEHEDLRASYALQKMQEWVPKNCEFSLSLARLAARNNDLSKVILYVRWAKLQNSSLNCRDVEKYQELQPFVAHPKIQKIVDGKE
jgi:serine/threonine protein kinase